MKSKEIETMLGTEENTKNQSLPSPPPTTTMITHAHTQRHTHTAQQ